MSSVKTIPLAGVRPSTRFTLKIAFSTTPARESFVAVTKSTASRARSKLLTLNSDISQRPSLRNRAMAGWSAGYRAARVRRQLTPGPISSLRRTAGSPPFTSSSTNYRELDSAVRPPMRRIGKRRSYISRSLKLLCLKRNIGNLSAIQEKNGYLLRQRGIERFVGKPEVICDRFYWDNFRIARHPKGISRPGGSARQANPLIPAGLQVHAARLTCRIG